MAPSNNDDEDEDGNRQTRSLAGLAVILLLCVASLFLIHRLTAVSRTEDCLMAGHTNCAPVTVPGR
ncbi:MAG: hypothetical protein P4M00_14780 [Azospirillaceae bacterium]|nr:hypothetical protein [Azospirillaceae bacterium]